MSHFKLYSDFTPKGDQPHAIDALSENIVRGVRHQTLLGVTGSGKTFTLANVIEQIQKPTLVISHNKTLAAQLYHEFKGFFPENAVEYFVSYYDYYQPEAYIPQTDIYIEKDSAINDAIDQMRHASTRSLLTRTDVIIVASVSCIYGLGDPEVYHGMLLFLEENHEADQEKAIKKLIEIQYQRNDFDFHRGTFRVRGNQVDIFPASSTDRAIRVVFLGNVVVSLSEFDPLTGEIYQKLSRIAIYPSSHFVLHPDNTERATRSIEEELHERIRFFKSQNKLIEAQRIEQRTFFDLEMMQEIGYCKGIENYSRHLTGRAPGCPPPTLLDYFPKDALFIIDESHATTPQIGAMQAGDRSRKGTLVEYGFRLPSAFDNRPLSFSEFEQFVPQVIYASATPGPYELQKSGAPPTGRSEQTAPVERCDADRSSHSKNGTSRTHSKGEDVERVRPLRGATQALAIIQQVIRPTGLVDPEVFVRPAKGQVDDLLAEIRKRVEQSERILVTTLTKRMAEDLTDYYHELGLKVRYLHSTIKTIERTEIIRDFRMGQFDTLIGVNLLREGLDLPEVSLVAILDADKEGFLRSARSLIQTAGRAARNVSGQVLLYAETVTASMQIMMDETNRRRALQKAYNDKHGITPQSIKKAIAEALSPVGAGNSRLQKAPLSEDADLSNLSEEALLRLIKKYESQMRKAAKKLDFNEAAKIRDYVQKLKTRVLAI